MIVFNFVTAEPLFSPCLLCFLLFILFPVTFPHTSQLVDVVQLLSYVRLFVGRNSSSPAAAHELQLSRLPCPSLSPGVCSNSCPLSRRCRPTISFYVTPFFSCPQSFPASGSFPVSQLFASSGQSIGALASASVLPMNIQG